MDSSSTPARPWRDARRFGWLLSALFPFLVWTNLLSYRDSGHVAWLWVVSFVMYVVLPLLDAWVGLDCRNPPEAALAELEARPWYRLLVVAYVPLQYLVTMYGAWIAVAQPQGPLGLLGWAGLLLSVGGINGVAINTAHELGHKLPRWERWLARVALAPTFYGHFYVEHNRGHHRHVATPQDPASARLGESFWAFLPRTMIGSLRSAWALEAARLAARGLGPWHWRNECLQAWAMTLLLFGGLCVWLGLGVLPFLLAQAFYGASLLESVNYIEHYGLLRRRGADGRLERCGPEHSWNSSHLVSNLWLFQLQRHSDHHVNPGRRYQALQHEERSPQLPSGYPALVLLAYFPPLWFGVMDPRLSRHLGGDLGRANLQPGRAARYGLPDASRADSA